MTLIYSIESWLECDQWSRVEGEDRMESGRQKNSTAASCRLDRIWGMTLILAPAAAFA